jgi:hypothetical protein
MGAIFRHAGIWMLFGLGCLLQLELGAFADPTNAPGDEGVGIFNEGTSASEPLVEGTTGVLRVPYEFVLAPARGRAQPRLSITYTSINADGEAGYGWKLDVPSIQRKPLSGWPTYDDDLDRFAIDGRPLVFICVVGDATCGALTAVTRTITDGPELFPDWAQGFRYYRRQVEGEFDRFFYSPDHRYWAVQQKGGDILVFGDYVLGSSTLVSVSPGVQLPLSGVPDGIDNDGEFPFRWHLTFQSDTHGNLVVYNWEKLGERGLSYLTDIYDTLGATATWFSFLDFANHTQLSWEATGLRVTKYAHVDHATPDLRLSRVAIASAPWSRLSLATRPAMSRWTWRAGPALAGTRFAWLAWRLGYPSVATRTAKSRSMPM